MAVEGADLYSLIPKPHSQASFPSLIPKPHSQASFHPSFRLAMLPGAAPRRRGDRDYLTARVDVRQRCMEMSASEEIPLQGVDDKKVEVGKLVELQEQVAPQGTSPNTKGTGAQSQWLCKKIFTTVATLIAYAFLNAGISMIAPFYPIAVSIIFIG